MSATDTTSAVKVMLWTHARSRSTAFELAIASDENIQVFHEEYSLAYFMGEERLCNEKFTTIGPSLPRYRYVDVKERFEQLYPGKTAVFAKEEAACLGGRRNYGYIPEGFINTFLVRNPRAAIVSCYKSIKSFETEADDKTLVELTKDMLNLTPIYELFKYLTEERHQRPILIDSEDLANAPEETIKKYCNATGIIFNNSFINWKPEKCEHFHERFQKNMKFIQAFHGDALRSSSFQPSSDRDANVSELPVELQQWVDACMPLYDEMIIHKL